MLANAWSLVCFLALSWSMCVRGEGIKIVDSLRGNFNANAPPSPAMWDPQELKPNVPPSPFVGSDIFEDLVGKCYSKKSSGYRYEVCLFHNVTQHDERTAWNSYHGVLGTFFSWIVNEDKLVGMHFKNGDDCHGFPREANVTLVCGENGVEIGDVTEPEVCKYAMELYTPVACNEENMSVITSLSEGRAQRARIFKDELHHGEISRSGYATLIGRLAMKDGLLPDPSRHQEEVVDDMEELHHDPYDAYLTEEQGYVDHVWDMEEEKLEEAIKTSLKMFLSSFIEQMQQTEGSDIADASSLEDSSEDVDETGEEGDNNDNNNDDVDDDDDGGNGSTTTSQPSTLTTINTSLLAKLNAVFLELEDERQHPIIKEVLASLTSAHTTNNSKECASTEEVGGEGL